MEVEKILDAGNDILNDVISAVETNQYQDLGKKIQGRVAQATSGITGNYRQTGAGDTVVKDDHVYTGTVEPTNKRDGIYRTNFAKNSSSSDGSSSAAADSSYQSGAYSSSAYRRYSSDRRTGPNESNSSQKARAAGYGYQGSQNRAGYQKVYGTGGQKGAYGKYDYRNPEQMAKRSAAENANTSSYAKGAYGRYDPHNPANRAGRAGAGQTGAQGQQAASSHTQRQAGSDPFFAPTPFNSKNVSTNTGLVPMVLGSVGMALGGVETLITGIGIGALALTEGAAAVVSGGAFLLLGFAAAFTGASGWLFSSGKRKKDTVSQYYQYGKFVGNAEFFKIRELAAKVGIKEKKLRKNLRNMARQGLLPQARLDDGQEMMLLTDKAYDQYRQAADSYRKRQEEEEKRANYFTSSDTDATVKELLAEGSEYLKKVRRYNDLIPDTQEMSNKLYRLENIMYRIFEQVKKKPDTAQSLRKFMEYYLPTTEKLLSAYIEVDKQPQVGDNITNTKMEIESAMDTINDAFEKLLDSLFEDLAWDVSSDISVMKTMLQQDGLTDGQISPSAPDNENGTASDDGSTKSSDPGSDELPPPPSGLVFGDMDTD